MILDNKLNITHQVEFATTAADEERLKQGTQVFGKITSANCLSAFAQS